MLYAGFMSFSTVIHDVWSIGLVLQVLLAVVLISRGVWRKFPVFAAYTLFSLLETAVLYGVFHRPLLYLYLYVIGESILFLLGLALVYEIFVHLFTAQPALRKMASLVFRVVVVLLVLLAGGVLYFKAPLIAPHGSGGISALLIVEEAARLLQVGLIMFLFLFSSAFGLHWRQHVFGVALGLGISSVVELVAVTMALHSGPTLMKALNLAHVASFDLSILIWLGYLALPERVASSAEVPQRAQLEQWNQAVMELINR